MCARVTGSFRRRSFVQSTLTALLRASAVSQHPFTHRAVNAERRGAHARTRPAALCLRGRKKNEPRHLPWLGSAAKEIRGSGGLDCVLERLARAERSRRGPAPQQVRGPGGPDCARGRLARAERSRNGRSDPDLRSRPGSTTRARLALTCLERAEARDLDSVPALQRLRDETGLRVKE